MWLVPFASEVKALLGEFLQQLFEFFIKRLSKRLRELGQPAANIGEIRSRLSQHHIPHIFDVPGTMREHLVDDQIFGRGESNRRLSDRHRGRTTDGLLLIGAVGKNEINPNARCGILAG